MRLQSDEVGSQITLPRAANVGKETLKQIIAPTEWEPVEKVAVYSPGYQSIKNDF